MENAHRTLSPGITQLLGNLYESALDATRWHAFLVQFGTLFRSEMSLLWAHDFCASTQAIAGGPSSLSAMAGGDPAFYATFEQHYSTTNVWVQDEALHREGDVVLSSMLYPDAQLTRTEWYSDWLKPQDLFHSFAAVIEKREQRSFNLTAVRSAKAGPYTPEEVAQLHTLMPHLKTAFALHQRLERVQALAHASLSVLDQLPMGLLLCDDRLRILHGNARAQQWLQAGEWLHCTPDKHLHVWRSGDDQKLQEALQQARRTACGQGVCAGTALRILGPQGKALQMLVTPLPRACEPLGLPASVAVFLSDPSQPWLGMASALRSLYRLTGAEARLAQALINGLTLQEYAQQQGLTAHTVRTQYKAASSKVGVGRQADFVRTLLTGPALLQWQNRPPPHPN